ncbi:MAG: glycosyltransferase family 39 protein [Chloroflexota bacterium]
MYSWKVNRQWNLAVLTLILLAAAFLRLHTLGDVPPGLEHDEVTSWQMADGVLQGRFRIYFTESYGHEPIFSYLMALSVAAFGPNWLGIRFWAPFLSLLGLAATCALARRLFDRRVALVATAFMAVAVWPLFFARLGLRLNLLPPLLCVTLLAFWNGLQTPLSIEGKLPRKGWRWFLLSGALLGATLHTYMASRAAPILLAGFVAYLALFHRSMLRGRWLAVGLVFLLTALLITPMTWYILTHPAAEIRTDQVNEPLVQLMAGNPAPVLKNALVVAGMFGFTGEPYWQVNVPGRPVFVEPVTIALFYGSLLLALWRWRQPRYALLLIWLAAGLLPSVVTADPPSFPRAFAALPVAFIVPGLAARALWERWPRIVPALLALAFTLNAGLTYHDYFSEWAVDPDVRYTFQTGITQAARYLDASQENSPVVMAGLSVHDVDPLTLAVSLRRRDLTVRWSDSRSALVLPAGDGPCRLLLPDVVPLDAALAAQLDRYSETTQVHTYQDGAPSFTHYSVAYAPDWRAYVSDLGENQTVITSPEVDFSPGDPEGLRQPHPLPLDLGDEFDFLGYEWLAESFVPGGQAELLTYWRVRQPLVGQRKVFVHLLDAHSQIRGSHDGLEAGLGTLEPGDIIIQLHRFWLAAETQPGEHQVEIGLYDPATAQRRSILIDGMPIADRLLLQPVVIE